MKILFVGDVVGKAGRQVVNKYVNELKKEHNIDFTIINGENAAHGKGLTQKVFNQLINYGADAITMGNHTYAKSDIYDIEDERLIVPMNLRSDKTMPGYHIFDVLDKKILVANICGEVFLSNIIKNPINVGESLKEIDADIKFIDFHAEATAEKISFMHYFKNDFSAIVGTHTHIQTADEDIFSGCAYISDVGMCGAYLSVIGRDIDEVITRMSTNEKTYYTVSNNPAIFCGVIIEICDKTNRAIDIVRIQIRPE